LTKKKFSQIDRLYHDLICRTGNLSVALYVTTGRSVKHELNPQFLVDVQPRQTSMFDMGFEQRVLDCHETAAEVTPPRTQISQKPDTRNRKI